MRFWQALLRAEMRALAALVGVCGVFATGFSLTSLVTSGNHSSSPWEGLLAFQIAFIFGLVPAAIFGAPIYTWLQRKDALTWPRVIVLGAVPGLVSLPWGWTFGATVVLYGVAVSCMTHYLARGDADGAL